ncbi:hypothetical protein RJ639_000937 [Escallonia herrerae]|uniref:THAP4-like heme-binding domain-containing protein n=1 Tax=Escallonia herrerae TaxID=1293975 RepID=A0AA88XHX5_9ASTE|nr:hypothetical protein RJ639_000937 [Escallonia herrerae]
MEHDRHRQCIRQSNHFHTCLGLGEAKARVVFPLSPPSITARSSTFLTPATRSRDCYFLWWAVEKLKPVIAYSQKTWKLSSGEPMHAETGYWRPKPDGTVEVVVAQSTGLVEVQKGTYDAEEKVVKLRSELVGNASKVKEITQAIKFDNGELCYVVEMATNLTSRLPHLKASLKKL